MFYRNLLLPVLWRMDPERAHGVAGRGLEIAAANAAGRAFLRALRGAVPDHPVTVAGLRFPNILGVAAGYDKECRLAPGLAELGFGHIETGTLTPLPQAGNPRPRVFRLAADRGLVNRMGFPNPGVDAVLDRLNAWKGMPRDWVLGVSMGKQKETPIEDATGDYITILRATWEAADYFAINISSPNTPGLRGLQGAGAAGRLTRAMRDETEILAKSTGTGRRPMFVKLAPDFMRGQFGDTVRAIVDGGADGLIVGNTTVARPGSLRSPARAEAGGLSGRPLARHATRLVEAAARATDGSVPIIGVGGIFDAEGAREKLDAGATLLQVYTGLVYEGPRMAGRILRGLGPQGPT